MTIMNQPRPTVYWIPGCGQCTRLKGYLDGRGLDFDAVDAQAAPGTIAELEARGIRTFPVLRVGDRWATGIDLRAVDELLGWSRTSEPRPLELGELCGRSARFLRLTALLAQQLPLEHYCDPTPTMQNFTRPLLHFDDGSPYLPHPTSKGLVHHIAGHGVRLLRLARASDGVHKIGYGFRLTAEDVAFGEPDDSAPMRRVVVELDLLAADIDAWTHTAAQHDASVVLQTHYGPQTIRELAQTMTASLGQHTRQLVDIIEKLGLSPAGMVADEDRQGLVLPVGIWE